MTSSGKKILVAPLDWGLGHATRCVPLINHLLSEGNEIVLASNGNSAAFLKNYFPSLVLHEDIPDYDVSYGNGEMFFKMMRQIPKLVSIIKKEHKWLEEFVRVHNIDEIISDNRYGLFHDSIPCTLITHQIHIRAPFMLSAILNSVIENYILEFDNCWVPDYRAEGSLSGKLSHGGDIPENVEYIGPLSRFNPDLGKDIIPETDSILVILSGPEPQRTLLENKLESLLSQIGKPTTMVLGQPGKTFDDTSNNIRKVSHLDDAKLSALLFSSETIICRAGYSTIMDLHVLKRNAILIPTPGQTEQEYLGKYHSLKGEHINLTQQHLSVSRLKDCIRRIQLHS